MHSISKSYKIDKPIISIITVVFNGERYINQTIESVIGQSYPNIEYIIVDGGSTDGTTDIIQRYESHVDYWVSESDHGLSDAMNKGARLATGDYVMHLHADDVLVGSSAISDLMKTLNESNAKWATGFYIYQNGNNKIIKVDRPRSYSQFDMLLRNIIRHQATVVPRQIFESISFDVKYKYAMDYMFFLNVWRKYGSPCFCQKHIAYFRLDGHNLSSDYYASIKDEMRVRRDYRASHGEQYKLLFDHLIYWIRVAKIYFYHSRKKNVG